MSTTTKHTDRQLDVMIAELCGWKWFQWGKPNDQTNCFLSREPLNGSMRPIERPTHATPVNLSNVPRYTADLNAMHQAEDSMFDSEEDAEIYEDQIMQVLAETSGYESAYLTVHATAKQRAIAFLRCKGIRV